MFQLITVLYRNARTIIVTLFLIVCVLAAGSWLRQEWVQIQSVMAELPAMQSAHGDVLSHQASLEQLYIQRMSRLSDATVGGLDAEIKRIDAELRELERAAPSGSLTGALGFGGPALTSQLRDMAVHKVDIELRRQARQHLVVLRAYGVALGNRRGAFQRLEQLRQAHSQAYADMNRAKASLVRMRREAGIMAIIPMTPLRKQIKRLELDVQKAASANAGAYSDYLAQREVIERLSAPAMPTGFSIDRKKLATAAEELVTRIRAAEQLKAQNTIGQAWNLARPVLPAALAILLAWMLVPVVVRAGFYYLLAPLASRRPPIVIDGAAGSPGAHSLPAGVSGDGAAISAVSQRLQLSKGQELLIRPDFCQSIGTGVRTSTRILFSWRYAFTSIASQLWMLTQIRPAGAAEVVVSSSANPLDEVGLLRIAAGEAFVMRPRAIVGLLYTAGQVPLVRSHWRLGTLHAWLTLQLRYVTFEGPVTLLVKGCRGVRLESAVSGRTISQAATLGFSARSRYATVRAEPFIPYMRGRQALFHDKIEGSGCFVLYEEVPRNANAAGTAANPVEAALDAGMKAFGI